MAKIQAPSGTRDMYPADLLKRRYIEKLWRDTSIRHGFEEIDGPTFETADLYAVKSGEGILSEVFQVYSGKDEAEVARIRGGANAPYALRPEFTPTLARMYAAKAGSLPKPTKWFWQQNCFRAEKQQRGRLREFGQWNCDLIGDPTLASSADLICVQVGCLEAAGLTPGTGQKLTSSGVEKTGDVVVHVSDRETVRCLLLACGVSEERMAQAFVFLDQRAKMPANIAVQIAKDTGFDLARFDQACQAAVAALFYSKGPSYKRPEAIQLAQSLGLDLGRLQETFDSLYEIGLGEWCVFDPGIVRGLAYYTGTVFEVLADGERAIAGGGRYDNLIELFGGPATPAVGFGMGDVVLSLVLQDRGLMPEGDALMDALSRPSASYRPDVFVIPAGQSPEEQEAAAKAVRPLVAKLRRGVESEAYLSREGRKPWDADRYALGNNGSPPLHARSSSKATKNIGKLLQDAAAQKAKLAVIVENDGEVTIKDLRTNQQDATRTKIAELGRVVAERLGT